MIHFLCFLSEVLCSPFFFWRQPAITGLTAIANVPVFSAPTDKLTPPRIRVDWFTVDDSVLHNSTNFSQVQETEQENNADHLSKKPIKTGIKQFMDSHKQLCFPDGKICAITF